MNSNKQNLINKIIYRSQYRGTKEMDIFVSSFVKSIVDSLSIDDLKDLDTLVNMNDEDISKISKNEMVFENKKILKLLLILVNAERLGFEPRKELPFVGFQDRCFQPLSHLSVSKVLLLLIYISRIK